ncbi:MAG: class I SAM-dependent methyltransferase [Chloroflexi bacterium]|nr:class I SAM-dependent methyltransferase [Chloroflexota bacterium]
MTSNSISFDRAADYYDATRGFPPSVEREAAALIAGAGGLTAATRVLELGIGTGRIALPMRPHTGPYFGIDIATAMMGKLREKQAAASSAAPIYLTQGDATRLPFAANTFDAIIVVHVFHLIPQWQAALDEAGRVLRPGGVMLYGWNRARQDQVLSKVWDDFIRMADKGRDGFREERADEIIGRGWTKHGDRRIHEFTTLRSPNDFLIGLKQRQWSHTWHIDDATHAAGVAAVEAHIAAHYDQPDKPRELPSSFNVQAFRPPQ